MPFRNQLAVQDIDGRGRRWRLTSDLLYHGNTQQFTVPAGFVTDFASIPRLFWRVLPPWDSHMRAAVLHDWLYTTGSKDVSRKDADGLFRKAMKDSGVDTLRRWVMWAAVRLFGGSRFRRR